MFYTLIKHRFLTNQSARRVLSRTGSNVRLVLFMLPLYLRGYAPGAHANEARRTQWLGVGFVSEASFGACLYEPGQPSWLGFRYLASPPFSLLKYRCVHMRGRAGPVTEITVTEMNFPIWTLKPNERDETGSGWKSLSQHSGQNGLILVLYVFSLYNLRNC